VKIYLLNLAKTHGSNDELIAATRNSLQQRLCAEKLIDAMSLRRAQLLQLSFHINEL